MAQIQPISIWYQGAQHEATIFTAMSKNDNLIDSATIEYQLIEEVINGENNISQTLVIDSLRISGQDYIDWDSSVSANEWIYNWAANKLNLTIVSI